MSDALPSGWAKVTLGDVVEVRDFEREPVNSIERAERLLGKSQHVLYPYYGATGQVGWIDDYRSEGEQVLLGEDGAPFLDPNRDKAYIVGGRYWVNNHAHVLRGIEGAMSNRFLAHQLNAADYHDFVTGSTRLKLTSAAMKKIPLLMPPHAEQIRIVKTLEELLSDLDAGVAELKAAQRKLVQYRQSLLKAAVEGALTADWRAAHGEPQETGAELLQRILSERRARWEQKQRAKFAEQGKTPPKGWQAKYPEPVAPDLTDLPALPGEWAWASIEQVGGVQLGRQRSPDKLTGTGSTPYIRAANITEEGIDLSDVLEMDFSDNERETFALNIGDVLLTEASGSAEHVGRPAIWQHEMPLYCFQNTVLRFTPQGFGSEFAFYSFLAMQKTGVFKRLSGGVGINHLSAGKFSKLAFALPPLSEQHAIVERLDIALTSCKHQQASIEHGLRQSAAQRKNILKAAFAGQLVAQDPTDESASELLARIRAGCTAKGVITSTKRGRKAKETA